MKNSWLIGFAFLAATLCLSPSSAIAQRSQEPSQDTPLQSAQEIRIETPEPFQDTPVQSAREIRNEAPEPARGPSCSEQAEDVCGEGNVASVTFNSSTGQCSYSCKEE